MRGSGTTSRGALIDSPKFGVMIKRTPAGRRRLQSVRVVSLVPMQTPISLRVVALCALAAAAICANCGSGKGNVTVEAPGDVGGSSDASTDGQGGAFIDVGNLPDQEWAVFKCQFKDDQDHDGDGYAWTEGDCNDCDPNVNPGAFDLVGGVDGGLPADEDCSGVVDDEPGPCDQGIAIDDEDAVNGARAIGLCRTADANATGKQKTWGVLSAKYVSVDGAPGMNPLSHGVVPQFGAANPQEGQSMLVLSSGTARAPRQPGFQTPQGAAMGTKCKFPAGYPKQAPACPKVVTGDCFDPAALEVQIRVPTNAKALRFNLNFYTYEFPLYTCSKYNDYFVTLMSPVPAGGQSDGNISFDQDGNVISVNNSLLRVCKAQTAGNKTFDCPLGTDLLQATGFEDDWSGGPHAATGWLQTQVPVVPGSIVTLRFAIWDSYDELLDSTVLLDRFEWAVEPALAATEPVPVPK